MSSFNFNRCPGCGTPEGSSHDSDCPLLQPTPLPVAGTGTKHDQAMSRCLGCGVDTIMNEHEFDCPVGNPAVTFAPLPLAATAGGTKHDQAKPRMDLLDTYALTQLTLVLGFGAKKYADDNWRSGIASRRLLAATLRHVLAYMDGQDLDEESNLSHLAHAMCNLMFAINLAHTKPELSDHRRTLTASEQEQADLSQSIKEN